MSNGRCSKSDNGRVAVPERVFVHSKVFGFGISRETTLQKVLAFQSCYVNPFPEVGTS